MISELVKGVLLVWSLLLVVSHKLDNERNMLMWIEHTMFQSR